MLLRFSLRLFLEDIFLEGISEKIIPANIKQAS